MKNRIFKTFAFALVLSLGFSSCSDMLNPNLERHDEIDEIAADTLYSYWGILRGLQYLGERYVILGECRGEFVGATQYVSDSIHSIMDYNIANLPDGTNRYLNIRDYYHVINECNAYIARCDTARVNGTNKSIMIKEYSQVVSIRAWVYLQLVLAYGEVPYIDTPMLTTAAIDAYRNDPAAPTINIENFVTKDIVKKLIEVRSTPAPDYGQYGRTTVVCDASLCIFPQNLVLGDIYLLKAKKGDVNSYLQAARYYYDYLNTEDGGCINPASYYCKLVRNRQTEEIQLGGISDWLVPFATTDHVSAKQETVTVIPSSTNKLWGFVQRGINELFGYTTEIKVNTNSRDTSTTATIHLELEYEHELGKSAAYDSLNMHQTYEAYIGNTGSEICTPILGGRDARYDATMSKHTKEGQNEQTIFIQKQNPYSSFSTSYPVIYRKASIWMRFAEALNGAGYPSYAFAVLKSGLCGNSKWFPTSEDQYEVVDSVYKYYLDEGGTITFESSDTIRWKLFVNNAIRTVKDSVIAAGGVWTDSLEAAYLATHTDTTYIHNEIFDDGNTDVVCNFISKREMLKAKAEPALNFSTLYLRGVGSQQKYVNGTTEYRMAEESAYPSNAADPITIGIHARGCGMIKYDERETTFNYVDQINRMRAVYGISAADQAPLTKEEIYDPNNLEKVQFAIANLITDEQGLETAFEGNRFFDLVRLSRATGTNQSLAGRVARRNGTLDPGLFSRLMNESNWYFKSTK